MNVLGAEQGDQRLAGAPGRKTQAGYWLCERAATIFLVLRASLPCAPPLAVVVSTKAMSIESSPSQDGQSVVQIEVDALPPYIRCFSKRAQSSTSPVQAEESGGGGAAEDGGAKTPDSIATPAQFVPPPSVDPKTPAQFYECLALLNFWQVTELPDSVVSFAIKQKTKLDFGKVSSVASAAAAEFWPVLEIVLTQKRGKWCEKLAEAGSLSGLKVAVSNGARLNKRATNFAAGSGNLEMLQWVVENGGTWDGQPLALNKAAENGHFECFKFAREHGAAWDEGTAARAAAAANVEMLKWARANGCPWDEGTCRRLAERGDLETLQWARENGCAWDVFTFAAAAGFGSIDLLTWLLENGCPLGESVCARAATYGKLNCLQWARQHGCPWDEMTCNSAAENGELACLQWARANGCPWDEKTCLYAALYGVEEGNWECLVWLRQNDCPWDESTQRMAREHGFPEPELA